MSPTRALGKTTRWISRKFWPNQRTAGTRELIGYVVIWLGLLMMGLYQQINMILLVAGLAAGPIVASGIASGAMLQRILPSRRAPRYVFSGDPLVIDYALENQRRWTAALAITMEDVLNPADRAVSGWESVAPRSFFARVPGRGRVRLRWRGVSPHRGRYRFGNLDLVTRAPFGLLERRATISASAEMLVYPKVGRLRRSWHLLNREATQTRRGRRHDRSSQQQEYHGLRDYRPGDSPRWIHWRTTARLGRPMIKEFEQQSEQDLAVLIDPWLPKGKPTAEQKEAVEAVIRFAATVCVETCRRHGRRLLLGWTGPTPGVRHGPASIRLLHELLEQMAVLRPAVEGRLAGLLDAMPPAMLREATLVIVSTRAVRIGEEFERTTRLNESSWRGVSPGRVVVLDASRGELDDYITFEEGASARSIEVEGRKADPEGYLVERDELVGGDRPGSAAEAAEALP